MSKLMYQTRLEAGIFTATIGYVKHPEPEITIAKPTIPPLANYTAEGQVFTEVANKRWIFRLLRVDEPVEGLTTQPIAVYTLVDES